MLEWKEYVKQLILNEHDFDNISISLDGSVKNDVPPIVKVSITMLDKMIEHQGPLNCLVFPEKVDTGFIFALMKLFHSIITGKLKSTYDPSCFKIGEKLKVGNAIVEYLGTEFRDRNLCLKIKTADIDRYSAPIKLFPIFQKVETKRRLSKFALFAAAKDKALAFGHGKKVNKDKIKFVFSMKTHMNSSVFFMTSVASVREQLSYCIINGKKAADLFYLAQTDYMGNISNISPGQMSGVPSMVLATDLYAIREAISKGAPVESIIIDGTNTSVLLRQLDALDYLIELKVPVVCVTDIANSFELEQLQARGVNIWRWDKNFITEQLYDASSLLLDKKINNCSKQSIKYCKANGNELTLAMKILSAHRKETEQQSTQMMKLFEKLNRLTFAALRTTVNFSESERDLALHSLLECRSILKTESEFLNEKIKNDYKNIISYLNVVYTDGYILQKTEMLKEYLKDCTANSIYLIIPDNVQKDTTQNYWNVWCQQNQLQTMVIVMSASDYYSLPISNGDITVICGWLKRTAMQKIIYSYNTSQYVVLLYDYEDRWRKQASAIWDESLRKLSNKSIIEKSLSTDELAVISPSHFSHSIIPEHSGLVDELGEIELILHDNKYRQYVNGSSGNNKIVAAIPIGFVGGHLAFYRTGHKIISTTKIILSESNEIELKFPSDLKIGDFIVVRETDRDIIRELADIILHNSGKSKLREIASKWREALRIELIFSSVEELHIKLKIAGCNKSLNTIKHWIDGDIIAPKSKEDLEFLATVTKNEVLCEMLDKIDKAAQEVRKAHILAGKKLSAQLKLTLGQELKKYGIIDPFNFWKPIDMEIEGIGMVKVLKIIDIGTEVKVDSSDTNRLIEE